MIEVMYKIIAVDIVKTYSLEWELNHDWGNV